MEETLPSFLPLALDRDERSAPHPICFTSAENPPVAGGLQRQSGRSGEGNTLFLLRRGAASSPVTIPPELSKLTCNTQATVCKSTSVVYSTASQLFGRSYLSGTHFPLQLCPCFAVSVWEAPATCTRAEAGTSRAPMRRGTTTVAPASVSLEITCVSTDCTECTECTDCT